MAERGRPALYTIPPHRPFADALVAAGVNQSTLNVDWKGKTDLAVPTADAAPPTAAATSSQAGPALSAATVRFLSAGDG